MRITSLPILSMVVLILTFAPVSSSTAGDLENAILKSGMMFHNQYKTVCYAAESGERPPLESHTIDVKQYDGEMGQMYLVGYLCDRAAYNSSEIWFLTDNEQETTAISFARPVIDFQYTDEESRTLKSWSVVGMESVRQLSGSSYDPKTRQISAFHKWRGLGDTHESLIYRLHGERFIFTTFEVDPTYDEKVNALTIIQYPKAAQ